MAARDDHTWWFGTQREVERIWIDNQPGTRSPDTGHGGMTSYLPDMTTEGALREIRQTAEAVLAESSEPVVRVRLLRDVLGRPDDDPDVLQARKLSEHTKLGQRLQEELQSGAHRSVLRTALDLGLPASHAALLEVKRYAESHLAEGVVSMAGRMSAAWARRDLCLFERDLASMLTQVDRDSPRVEGIFVKWAIVAGAAFGSGRYDRDAQVETSREIFEPAYQLRQSVKSPEHTLADASMLLAARADRLDPTDDAAYVAWCVSAVRKLEARIHQLLDPSCRRGSKCLSAVELLRDTMRLYGFRSWRSNVAEVVDCFWRVRRDDGFWDFGATCINPPVLAEIRFADNWRSRRGAHDWTTRVLLLLQKYYAEAER